MTITADTQQAVAVAQLPAELAQSVSRIEPSTLHLINGVTFSSVPTYVTQEAIQNGLHQVLFTIPDSMQHEAANATFVTVEVPVGMPDTSSVVPFIPLDAVYQTQNEAFVYVIANGKAKAKTLTLGNVFGQFVQVDSGLASGDKVILDRSIISGDPVEAEK